MNPRFLFDSESHPRLALFSLYTMSPIVIDTGLIDITLRTLPNINQFDASLFEFQSNVVDSMSSPQPAEYTSAQGALARDRTSLQLIDQDLEECRMRIARLHAQMHLLECQRNAVQRRMSLHRARLSPLRTVPDQVLQEIFRHCLPDTTYLVPDACSAPLVLTHICRRWRAVAQGTSELWSSVTLHDRGVWNYELEVEMVKRWINRSRMRPICVSITCPPRTDFGLGHDATCSAIFQVVMAHGTHLRDLRLNVNKTYLHHFLEGASLPALRSIVISLHSIHRNDEPVEVNTPAVLSAPNLRRIEFNGDGTSIDLVPRTIFPQITHLSFDCNMAFDLALLFRDFSNLECLALTLSLSHDALRLQLHQRDHRIVAQSLLRLEVYLDKDMLEFGDPETLETLLDPLDLPALRTFAIAAPLRPTYNAIAGRTQASWENHVEWVRSPSVASLLSRSRRTPRPEFECRDLISGGVQPVTLANSA